MPLFHPRVIEKHIKAAKAVPPACAMILAGWAKSLGLGTFDRETSHDSEFVQRILIDILGYAGSSAGAHWTVGKNQPVGSGNVDVALGHFSADKVQIIAPFELKGAKTRNLDAIMPGRNKSPVQQAWEYAMDAKGAKWVLLSNYREIRLYAVGFGRKDYERFDLSQLNEPANYARFMLLLSAENLLGARTSAILQESETKDKEITDALYKDYKELRALMVNTLTNDNPGVPVLDIIQYTQTILDRILFVAFAEDRELLPDDTLKSCYEDRGKWNPQPAWDNFKGLFHSIDKGNPPLKIPGYNGGLFATNDALNSLIVSDVICEGFKTIGGYDFESDVSVNILGHIFEQSITDLEEIKASVSGADTEFNKKKNKRKKDGIFYTPTYITRYIVEQAVGGWLNDRKQELGLNDLPEISDDEFALHAIDIAKYAKKATQEFKTQRQKVAVKIKKHISFWETYETILKNIKILDPSCGSGAFLNEVFDYLSKEGDQVNEQLLQLTLNQHNAFKWDTHILANNIFGVDINQESVEITKLSLWLKTANKGEKLTYLDNNIKCGNSLIDDPTIAGASAFKWEKEFSNIMKKGGFDVVVGNPPWVSLSGKHGQKISDKMLAWLIEKYDGNTYMPNLFEYFIYRAFGLLSQKGYFCMIIPDRLGFNLSFSKLREHILRNTTLKEVIYKWDFPGVIADTVTFLIKNAVSRKNDVRLFSTPEDQPIILHQQALLKDKDCQIKSFANNQSYNLVNKIISSGTPLVTYAKITSGFGGKSSMITEERISPTQIEAIRGSSIGRYMVSNKVFFDFLDENITGRTRDESKLGVKYKVLIRKTGDRITAAFDESGIYAEQSAYFIYEIEQVELKFVLAALNCNLSTWFYKNYLVTNLDSTPQIKTFDLEKIPLPPTDKPQRKIFIEKADVILTKNKELHDISSKFLALLKSEFGLEKLGGKLEQWYMLSFATFIAELAKKKVILTLTQKAEWMEHFEKQKTIAAMLKATIDTTDHEIDQLVYGLYNLTPDEIAIVEGVA